MLSYRKLRSIDHKVFGRDLIDSPLLSSSASNLSVSELSDRYQSVLSSVLEAHAPLQRKMISARPSAPWYNNEIASQKTLRCKLEWRWRRTKLDIDRQPYTNQCVRVQDLIINSKMKFYSKLIRLCVRCSVTLQDSLELGFIFHLRVLNNSHHSS